MPQADPVTLGILGEKVDGVKRDVAEIKLQLNTNFVTQEAFRPVQTLVYGATGAVCLAVIAALLALALKQGRETKRSRANG